MSNPTKTAGLCFVSRFRRTSIRLYLSSWGAGAVALTLAGGCAVFPDASSPGSLRSHVEYMNRAAGVDSATRERMIRELESQPGQQSVTSRLKIGFLLTSPGENQANTQAGEQVLREVLAQGGDLPPTVTTLVELRLSEVEARQVLFTEVRDLEGKIDDLMSIESSMEKKKSKSQTRPR